MVRWSLFLGVFFFGLLAEASPDCAQKTLKSFWMRDSVSRFPALSGNDYFDVAIIGAGVTGLSTAIRIAENNPSLKVAVLEAGLVGAGASGRNGGLLLTQTAADYMHLSTDTETHLETYRQTSAAISSMKALLEKEKLDADLKQEGSLFVYRGTRAPRALNYLKEIQGLGLPFENWDKTRVMQALGTERYDGAIFDPGGGFLNPGKWVQALAEIATRRGVLIFERSRVESITEGKESLLKVRSEAFEESLQVRTPSVVLATNVSSLDLGYFKSQVLPIHVVVGITPVLPAERLAKMQGWQDRLKYCDSKTMVHYWGLTQDGRIHLGGGFGTYHLGNSTRLRPPTAAAKAQLENQLHQVFPELSDIQLEQVWPGTIDTTADLLPSVGVRGANHNLYYSIGMNGHGLVLSYLHGMILADLITGRGQGWENYPYLNYRNQWMPPDPARWAIIRSLLPFYRIQDSIAEP